MSHSTIHTPVLLREAIEYLAVSKNRNYIDATFGGGGYTREILKRNSPDGRVLALDRDEDVIERGREDIGEHGLENWILKNKSASNDPPAGSGGGSEIRYPSLDILSRHGAGKPEPQQPGLGSAPKNEEERLKLLQGNFADIKEIARSYKFKNVNGIVFDLGLSADTLSFSGRGFSFEGDEPLLMTFSKKQILQGGKTAQSILKNSSQRDLERIFKEYGEEKYSTRVAKEIVGFRKKEEIKTTGQLRKIIEGVIKEKPVKSLARIFQAIRIEVNDELESLGRGLEGAWDLIEEGGVIVVVSFHSLEDRIVKNFFKAKSTENNASILTPKPIGAGEEEILKNPRSRSAKLRAIRK